MTPEFVIPASAKQGTNIANPSSETSWYQGPTVLESLSRFSLETARAEQALRFPVQDVYKFDARRILVGRISAGKIKVGDRLVFSPSNKSAAVQSIEAFNIDPLPMQIQAGQSVGITLDEQIFVERGEIASHEDELPLVSTRIRANVFWLGNRPLEMQKPYFLRLGTREVACEISTIHRIVDANNLDDRQSSTSVQRNEVADVTLKTKAPFAFDTYAQFEVTARFVLVDEYDVSGGGIITEFVHDKQEDLRNEARQRDFAWIQGDVGAEARAEHYGHRAAMVLLTGNAWTGKAFLARKVEALLVAEGRHAYLLDAQNLRRGLDADLEKADESEMVRRFGEVARLLVDTGLIVVSTTNPFNLGYEQVVSNIRTLLHPTTLVTVHMTQEQEMIQPDADLVFAGPEDFDGCARQMIEVLKGKGILAEPIGTRPVFQYSI